jgi:ankyrin repeat protein
MNRKNWTAPHFAARKGQDDIVTLLLDCGADLNACCNQNMTPLQHARENHQNAVENILQCRTERRQNITSADIIWDMLLEELRIRAQSVALPGDIPPFLTWITATSVP